MSKTLKFDPENPYAYSKKVNNRDKKTIKRIKKIINGINNCQESGEYMSSGKEDLGNLGGDLE